MEMSTVTIQEEAEITVSQETKSTIYKRRAQVIIAVLGINNQFSTTNRIVCIQMAHLVTIFSKQEPLAAIELPTTI